MSATTLRAPSFETEADFAPAEVDQMDTPELLETIVTLAEGIRSPDPAVRQLGNLIGHLAMRLAEQVVPEPVAEQRETQRQTGGFRMQDVDSNQLRSLVDLPKPDNEPANPTDRQMEESQLRWRRAIYLVRALASEDEDFFAFAEATDHGSSQMLRAANTPIDKFLDAIGAYAQAELGFRDMKIALDSSGFAEGVNWDKGLISRLEGTAMLMAALDEALVTVSEFKTDAPTSKHLLIHICRDKGVEPRIFMKEFDTWTLRQQSEYLISYQEKYQVACQAANQEIKALLSQVPRLRTWKSRFPEDIDSIEVLSRLKRIVKNDTVQHILNPQERTPKAAPRRRQAASSGASSSKSSTDGRHLTAVQSTPAPPQPVPAPVPAPMTAAARQVRTASAESVDSGYRTYLSRKTPEQRSEFHDAAVNYTRAIYVKEVIDLCQDLFGKQPNEHDVLEALDLNVELADLSGLLRDRKDPNSFRALLSRYLSGGKAGRDHRQRIDNFVKECESLAPFFKLSPKRLEFMREYGLIE